jgi:nucleoside-diphosphate-sugar epimerase
MRILVIGGTAFMGPFVVRALARRGHEVVLFHRGRTPAELPEGVRHLTGDRRNLAASREELRRAGPEVVLDMIPLGEADARAVLDTFRGVARRAVAVSSMDVYRAFGIVTKFEEGTPDPRPLTEDSPVRSKFYLYRHLSERLKDYEKILVERAILADPGLPGTVLRLPAVFGPGDYQHRLFPYLKRMDDGRLVVLLGKGEASWRDSHGYVENVAAAIALAAADDRAAGRVYNVADTAGITQKEWVRSVAAAAGWKGEIAVLPDDRLPAHLREDMVAEQHLVADTSRIRNELGWREEIPLDEALRRTVAWERAHPPKTVDPAKFDYAAEDAAWEQWKRNPRIEGLRD